MYAPPLYVVRKFKFREIVVSQFDLHFDKKQEKKYLIKQNDSQMLRQIRLITKNISKYNPYIVFVDIRGSKSDKENLEKLIREGFNINDKHYVLSERSASMTRNGILSYVDETLSEELSERIGLGVEVKKTVLSKYMAYRGLSLSSCHCIENWLPKIIVIPDYKRTIKNQNIKYVVDEETEYTTEDGETRIWKQKNIENDVVDLEINAFDGMGIMHPAIAEQLRVLLGLDEVPTTIQVRLPFIKGLVHQLDYSVYLKEHNVKYITDIWGWKHNVDDIMIIMTESMYKGYKYFNLTNTHKDWEDYWVNFKKYQYCFGVAKWNFTIEEEPIYTRANYQILQDLELSQSDFAKLYQDSIDWINKVVYDNPFYTYCFLGLRYDKQHALNDYVQSILYNSDMIKEESVRNYLISLFRKYVDDMKCGKIYLKSTFKFLCPDLIMFLQYLTDGIVPIEGSLQSDEFWSKGKNGVYNGEYALERNPHLAQSEHAILKAVQNDDINRWCSHLTNVAMVNCNSILTARLSGADFDGDLVNVVNNKIFLKGINRDLPIVIDIEDKITSLEEDVTLDNQVKLVMRTLHSLIGETSNCATCYYNKNVFYKNEDGEYVDENGNLTDTPVIDTKRRSKYLHYIDLLSIVNGKNIDFSKTGVMMNIPRHIAKYSKPLPYFMKYAGDYYKTMKKWNYAETNMNYMCYQIEHWEKKVLHGRNSHKIDKDFDYSIMTDRTIIVDRNSDKYKQIEEVFLRFYKEMSELTKEQHKFSNYRVGENMDWIRENYPLLDESLIPDFEFDWNKYYEEYRNECKKICSNPKELANIVVDICYCKYPKKSKKFIWKVASEGILSNLKSSYIPIPLPALDDKGEYEYLGKRFTVKYPEVPTNYVDEAEKIIQCFEEWEEC